VLVILLTNTKLLTELGDFEWKLIPGIDAALRSVKSEKTIIDNENK
jgi:hypothetical protein